MKSKTLLPLIAVLACLASACTPDRVPFDRPGLLERAAEGQQHELRAADRHILVVRHARKVAPDCNALDCGLSERGTAMVARLAETVGPEPFGAAFASSACRTMLTAAAGGVEVVAHQPVDGMGEGCSPGEPITRTRAEAFQEAYDSEARWTIAGEHSNTSCLWLAEFAGAEAATASGCSDGRLSSDAYGHIYWLYRLEGVWRLTVLEGAFEVEG